MEGKEAYYIIIRAAWCESRFQRQLCGMFNGMAILRRKRVYTGEGPIKKRLKWDGSCAEETAASTSASASASASGCSTGNRPPQDADPHETEVQTLRRTLDVLIKSRDVDQKKANDLMDTYAILIGLLTTKLKQIEAADKAIQVDQGQLLTMAQNMHDIQSPVVSEPFQHNVHHSVIEPVPQHMVPERMPLIMDHMQQHPPIEKQLNHSPIQIHHQGIQEQPTVNHIDSMGEHTIQPCIERQQQQTVQPCVDGQQPNLEPCPSTPTPPPQPEPQVEEAANLCVNGSVTPTQVEEPDIPVNNERNALFPDSENTLLESATEAEPNHQPSKEIENPPEDMELPEADKVVGHPEVENAPEAAVPNDQGIPDEQGISNDQGIPVEDARLGVSETNDKKLCQQQQSDDYGTPSSVGPTTGMASELEHGSIAHTKHTELEFK